MWQEKANFSITRMARLLRVSRSGYYKWEAAQRQKAKNNNPQQNRIDRLDQAILRSWVESDRVYGAPRIAADLHDWGIDVNVKTVAKRMQLMGIAGISPRGFRPITTIQSKKPSNIPDHVQRHFDQGELNKVWLSDITYLRTKEGFVYLCAIRDAHSRRVIGWAMDDHQSADLVERALRMAYTLRRNVPEGVVFHSDRGCQYTSEQLARVCEKLKIERSMGRTGVCWDNAMAESFWSTLKSEYFCRRKWETRAQAQKAVACWIEQRYNRKRRHSSIGMMSPVDFENMIACQSSS